MRRHTRHFIGGISLLALALDGCSSSPTRPDAPKPAASVSDAPDPCAIAARLRSKVQPLLESGRLHRSAQVIQKADQLCPASAAITWPPLAATLVELGRYAEARRIAASIEADPKASSEARAAAAATKAKCNELDKAFPDTEDAKKEMRRLLEEGQKAEQANDSASLGIAEEKYIAAWNAWRPNGDALLAAGRVAQKLGQTALAQRLFDRALADVERDQHSNVVLDIPNGFSGKIHALTWSLDGQRLVVAHGREISFFDAAWHEVARFTGHTEPIQALAFSPDGQTLASGGGDHAIWLWNAATGEVRKKLAGHKQPILSLDYAPDGKTIVSTAGDDSIRFWDSATGNIVRTMDAPHDALWAKYSPDGKMLAAIIGNQVSLLNLATNKPVFEAQAYSAAFAPNGQWIATTDHNETLWLWSRKNDWKASRFLATDAVSRGFVFAPDNKTIAAIHGKTTIRIWDVAKSALEHALEGHTDQARVVRFSPDGKILASGGDDRTVRLWDVATGKPIHTLAAHASRVKAFAYAPDGKTILSGLADNTLRWWDLERGQLKPPLTGHSGAVQSLAFARDGRTFVSGSKDNTAILRDATDGHVLHILKAHTGAVSSLAYAPNGKTLATASEDRTVRTWDIATGKNEGSLGGNLLAGQSILFAPDGEAMAVASWDSTVRVWDLKTGELGRTFLGHSRPVMVIAAPPNGKAIASGSVDQTVRIWDVKTSETKHELKGHTDFVFALAYSQDGKKLASGSADNTVRVWDATNGQPLQSWADHSGAVFKVEFSPDGQQLVSSSEDGSLQWHRTNSPHLVATVRALDSSDAGYVFVPTGHFDFLGSEACVASSLPVCRIGSVVWPFAVCAERFYAPGLLRKMQEDEVIAFDVEDAATLPCPRRETR